MPGGRMLVVEDESIVAQDIRGRLEALGYQVVGVAYSAEDAITKAAELYPDLVLMDIKLKGSMDGIEAAGAIRAQNDIPAVFLTAYTDDDTLRRARMTEPFGYLVKPFQDRELHATIEIALYKHRTERAVRASELKFRTLVQLAPDPIVMTDRTGAVTLWNRAAETMFGFVEGEMLGRHIAGILGAEGDEKGRAMLAELSRKGSLRGMELSVRARSGDLVPVEVSASVMRDSKDNETGTVAIWRDISDRKRAHREMMSRLMAHDLEEGKHRG